MHFSVLIYYAIFHNKYILRFREFITLAVLSLREDGELQKLEKKWWYDKGQCEQNSDNSKVMITI